MFKNILYAAFFLIVILDCSLLISCSNDAMATGKITAGNDEISISPIESLQTPDIKVERDGSEVRMELYSYSDCFARITYNPDSLSYKGLESASSGWSAENAIVAAIPAGIGIIDFGAVQFDGVNLPGEAVLVFKREPEQNKCRLVSGAPTATESAVADFTLTDNGSDGATCTWHYRNTGDYDQSGEVGIPDITPIAINYLCLVSAGSDDPYAPIDGDGNGELGIPDITPIALNYLRVVTDYELQYSVDGSENSYSQLATITFEDGIKPETGAFINFTHELAWAGDGFYRVVPVDSADSTYGVPSNVVHWQSGHTVALAITLVTTGVTGTGTSEDPFILDAVQPFEFSAMRDEDDVTDQVDWLASPEFAVSWSATTSGTTEEILDIAGDFQIYCTLDTETSNLLYCRKHLEES